MIKEVKNKISWLNILNPSEEDFDFLKEKFKLKKETLDYLGSSINRNLIEENSNYFFTVYHIPLFDGKDHNSRLAEIDFIVTKNTVITISQEEIQPLEELFAQLKAEDKKGALAHLSSEKLFYEILHKSLVFSLRQLGHIKDKIKNIDASIFQNKEKEMIQRISYIKRDILNQRLIARPQKTFLKSLMVRKPTFFSENSLDYFQDLLRDHYLIWDTLDDFKETIESLEATNNTLFESKTNERMKVFTVLAFFTFPLSLVVNLFSMNTIYTPLVNNPYGFWIIAVALVLIALSFYTIFKIKKWL